MSKATQVLTPCMTTVRVSDGAVSAMPLTSSSLGLALSDGATYERVGQIRPAEWTEPGKRDGTTITRSGFAWYFEGAGAVHATGFEASQKAAVAALLHAAGFIAAPPNAVNPGLFEIADGS